MILFRRNGKETDITMEGTDDQIDWFRLQLARTHQQEPDENWSYKK